MDPSPQSYLTCKQSNPCTIKFRNAKRQEIYKILINIDPNKAYGIDEFPGRFIKMEWKC